MAKRRNKQHGRAAGKATLPRPQEPSRAEIPNAQTFARIMLLDRQTQATLRKVTSTLKPVLWMRDRERIALIKQAETPAALIELAPMATGLAETTWQDRMRKLGPEVIPLIRDQLKNLREIRDKDQQGQMLEKLVAELRWRGDAGAEVLLDAFDALDDYGRSLACVVLGLLHAPAGADRIWSYYQKAVRNQRETYFVGALWGLIDLKDERAGGALAELLRQRRPFQELFGFLALAGDRRAVLPLIEAIIRAPEDDRFEAAMALTGIAHRIGRAALLDELAKISEPERGDAGPAAMADSILGRPEKVVEEYFEMFYRGITPADMAKAFGE